MQYAAHRPDLLNQNLKSFESLNSDKVIISAELSTLASYKYAEALFGVLLINN